MCYGFSFNWKTNREIDKTTFKDELQRSVLLSMNEQIDDEPESRTADGYKTHLELLTKRLKYNGRLNSLHGVYDWSMFIWIKTHFSRKHETFDICNQTFLYYKLRLLFIELFNLATIYYRISCISLPLGVVRRKFKLIKKIVNEDEDFWMNGYQWMLNAIFIIDIKICFNKMLFQLSYNDFNLHQVIL